jgi:hypothetical protein
MLPGIRGVWFWQALTGLMASLAMGFWLGMTVMFSLAWGVLLAMGSGYFLARRLSRAALAGAERGRSLLHAGAAWRFLGVLAGLALAWALGLHLLVVAAGMLLAQLVMFVVAALGAGRSAANGME